MPMPPAGAQLIYRSHDADEPASRAAREELLHDVFGLDLRALDILDARDSSYTPFSYFDARGRCIANVGVFPMPMVVRGQRIDALAIQSVAVRPEHRRHGLCRDLLSRALAWCDAHARLVLLRTAIPDLYARFGFREMPQHCFVGLAPVPDAGGPNSARAIALPADLALVKRLLRGRSPVSDRVGLLAHGPMFLLNIAAMDRFRLHHLPMVDAIIVSEAAAAGQFRLIDIVGRRIPPLASILGALAIRPDRVEICFPPDKLHYVGDARPIDAATVLMARGNFVDASERFMLPPTSDF